MTLSLCVRVIAAEKEEAATGELDVEIKLPSLPNSKEQFLQSWAEGYVHNKNILSSTYRLLCYEIVNEFAYI